MAQMAVEITGEERNMLNTFRKMRDEIEDLKGKLKEAAKASRNAAKETQDGFGAKALGGLKNYVTGLVGAGGVLAALQLVNRELQNQAEFQGKAADAQMRLNAARQTLIGNVDPAAAAVTQEKATELAKETGVDEAIIAEALANSIGPASGDLEAAASAVTVAAKFLKQEPEAIPDFAGSLLDVAKVSGSDDAELNFGLLQAVGGMSRVVDPRAQAMNIPGAMIGMKELGATKEEAASLFGALTNASADIMGAASGTAGISLAEQLRGFSQSEGADKKFEAEMGREMTMGERIQWLQLDPKAGEKFLENASFEKKFVGPIEQLIKNPGSGIAQAFRDGLSKLGSDQEIIESGRGAIEARWLDPLEPQAEKDRLMAQTSQSIQTGDLESGSAGIMRERLTQLLQDAGVSAAQSGLTMKAYDARVAMGADPDKVAQDVLLMLAKQLEATTRTPVMMAASMPTAPPTTFRETPPTEEELRRAAAFRELAGGLGAVEARQDAMGTETAPAPIPADEPLPLDPAVQATRDKYSARARRRAERERAAEGAPEQRARIEAMRRGEYGASGGGEGGYGRISREEAPAAETGERSRVFEEIRDAARETNKRLESLDRTMKERPPKPNSRNANT